MKFSVTSVLFLVLLLSLGSALAEQKQSFGQYDVHYNALPTNFLTPQVAREYDIKRSKNRALLNVTVQERQGAQLPKAVPAKLKAMAVNLNSQMKTLGFKEIRQGDAIYYIADFPVTNSEVLDFTIMAELEGRQQPFNVNFRQTFYTR